MFRLISYLLIFTISFFASVALFEQRQPVFVPLLRGAVVRGKNYRAFKREPQLLLKSLKGDFRGGLVGPESCQSLARLPLKVPQVKEVWLTGEGKTGLCLTPEEIVIHWSESSGGNSVTWRSLRERGLSCHFAVDEKETWQMLEMYEAMVELGYCTGSWEHNLKAINLELAGSDFDQYPPKGAELDRALRLTCFLMKQYGIPKSKILGHFEISPEKKDPGEKFLQDFKALIDKRCF